jgi:hypothetical protein
MNDLASIEHLISGFLDKPSEHVSAGSTQEAPPPGYRWVKRAWVILPDGSRDYAMLHGLKSFRFLAPMSSRLRTPRH